MGSEGWCLLVCLALSGAADAVESQWRAVDVILDCFLMGEGGHHGGFASRENMVKALLVLKQVPVPDDGSLEGLTDFQGGILAEDDPLITFEASVEFQVTTQTPSLNLLLGSSASLHCGFSVAPGLGITSVEWRLQHKGSGQLVYLWTTGQGQARREGATLEPQQLLMAGDASLTLPSLTLKDEGAYVCQITTSLYRAQQIIRLDVQAAPKVRLSLASEALPPTLVCSVTGYYPLDVTVTWIREELGGAPAPVSGASYSSLRQSMAGTYSISSSLTAEPGSVGATYTCQVTHVSLEEPLGANTWVAPPGMGVPSFPHLHTWAHGSCPLALFCFPQPRLLLSQGDSLQRSHPTSSETLLPPEFWGTRHCRELETKAEQFLVLPSRSLAQREGQTRQSGKMTEGGLQAC
ncbi:tapasin-related protein isoform X3 [Physeter macrocephalus]|uniref:Tapasin-related protein n=1 Tax=Physeter macrocephalus TaxID=9755 RepID=A0A455AYD1_PHYMC|nr:tapasin-related protein isoform X3 [Physeter catodon]|eukprot:XP_028341660.1 tapasin-related protein isoform X3 [Physeter catodon]